MALSYRIRDVLVAVVALLILSPIFLLIALCLRVSQPRVIFRQRRPGFRERPFWLYKFSTLYDAPPGWDEYERQQARLTPLGKYLRRWSLDELPQLWNVLKGDMSLVGPRPLLMAYLPLYSEEQRHRHDVPPGITGWAQIHGRNALSFQERFALDIWYVENRSFWLDLKILGKTLGTVFAGRGVYADGVMTSEPFTGKN